MTDLTRASDFLKKVEHSKYEKLLDLMRRATANGTHSEVAAAVSADWHPLTIIDAEGNIGFKIQRRDWHEL